MPFHVLDSIDTILAAAARLGVALSPDGAMLDTSGLDFIVVHARALDGTRWIVRAPRRPDVLAGAAAEARVLSAVRPVLAVAVPDWRITDEVIAYPRLGGTPAVTLDTGAPVWNVIDPAAPPAAFVTSLGAMLAALQRVPDDGLPARTLAEERRELARAVELARELLSPPDATIARWSRWIDNDALWPAHVALSHGDLHPGHLLLDERGALSGVLDWTEARVGDPGIDLAMVYQCFGRATLEAVAAAFAAHGGTTWDRLVDHAIERAAIFPALAAEWAHRTGNDAILEYARSQLNAQLAAAAPVPAPKPTAPAKP
jgi:aminoglycoside phosphotransferase (APT) family kinase protein